MTVNGKTTNVITHYLEAYGGNTFHGIDDAFVTRINAGGTGLEYSSYLGGGGEDIGEAITVDSNYCAYVVGVTSSGNFPVTNALGSQLHYSPAAQPTVDAFVSKLSADGRSLVYSTYLGGNSRDAAMSVALDSVPDAYIAGFTFSTNFPVTAANFTQWTSLTNLNADVFVVRLNSAGGTNSIVANDFGYSVQFGGKANDEAFGIAVDAGQNAYVTGFTGSSTNFAGLSTNDVVTAPLSATNSSVACLWNPGCLHRGVVSRRHESVQGLPRRRRKRPGLRHRPGRHHNDQRGHHPVHQCCRLYRRRHQVAAFPGDHRPQFTAAAPTRTPISRESISPPIPPPLPDDRERFRERIVFIPKTGFLIL